MEKLSNIIFLLCSLFLMIATPHSYIDAEQTNLRFYVRTTIRGENRTLWEVARANTSNPFPTGFGILFVLDDPITSGPELGSEEVGRFQGLVTPSDLKEIVASFFGNIVFTNGEHNGSTLSITGRNLYLADEHEWTIVGGTGGFRMASGYVIDRTVRVSQDYGLYEYDAVVFHGVNDAHYKKTEQQLMPLLSSI